MTVNALCERLGLVCVAGMGGLDRDVSGCYLGDLLSHAMSRLEKGNVWITVMGHVNAVAVGVHTQAGCILLCEGAALDGDAAARADQYALPVLVSEQSAFALAAKLHALAV